MADVSINRGRKIDILAIDYDTPIDSFTNDLIDRYIGHVHVIKEVAPQIKVLQRNLYIYRYLCRCDCGTEFIAYRRTLIKKYF